MNIAVRIRSSVITVVLEPVNDRRVCARIRRWSIVKRMQNLISDLQCVPDNYYYYHYLINSLIIQ